jgi:hypothetical protein
VATLPFSASAIAAVGFALRGGLAWALAPLLISGLGAQAPASGAPGQAGAVSQGSTPAAGAPAGVAPTGVAPTAEAPRRLPNSMRVTGGPTEVPPAPTPPGAPGVPGTPGGVAPAPPMSEAAFAALLRSDDLEQLNLACAQLLQEDNIGRLRLLQNRLLELRPAPQPLEVVLANAEVLLSCRAPEAALTVLDRYGPGPGPRRVQWLLMQWRAATAALNHRRAALALDRLTQGREANLNALSLPIRRREDGTVVNRSAVEVLAGHLEARGFPEAAGQLLRRQAGAGAPGAERLGRAAALLQGLPAAERDAILELALEQAAAAGAWSLVTDLLDAQAALPGSRAVARRVKLSPRLDDAYGEWLLRREDPAAQGRARQLERLLRSPRAPGGHAESPPSSPPLPPTSLP